MQSKPSGGTPLPIKQMIPLAFVLLNESLCSTILLPYIGMFVAFITQESAENAGYLTGTIFGMFMLGQLISSKMWGTLSDHYGRKPALVWGLVSGGLMMLFFGFTTTITSCILFRFLHGLFNGNVLVAKTVLADILDRTNEVKGFTLVSLTYGFGILVGPALGGMLYDPSKNPTMQWLGVSKDGIFSRHPGLMPALACYIYSLFATLVCCIFLEETSPGRRQLPTWLTGPLSPFRGRPSTELEYREVNGKEMMDEEEPSVVDESNGGELSPTVNGTSTWCKPVKFQLVEEKEAADEIAAWRKNNGNDSAKRSTGPRAMHEAERCSSPGASISNTAGSPEFRSIKTFGYVDSIRDNNTRKLLILYMLLCFGDMIFSEVFPLWAIAGTSHGGLGYSPADIGKLLLTNSPPCLLSNLSFHTACKLIPDKLHLWRVGMVGMALSMSLLPLCTYLSGGTRYVLLLSCTFARQWFSSWSFGLVAMFTARIAPPFHVGTMYGITQSCAAMVRCVGPCIITCLFAWSISGNKVAPFNHMLVFLIAAITFLIAGAVCSGLQVEGSDDVSAHESYVVVETCEPQSVDRRNVILIEDDF
uniref:Putative transporter n=1 Tax=Trypanosoma congolense (strain IL3000) TaxID=1068625 RepID=G0UUS0_TRYCI|nr:putative transporter [Trypanosoma congolense IL3000]